MKKSGFATTGAVAMALFSIAWPNQAACAFASGLSSHLGTEIGNWLLEKSHHGRENHPSEQPAVRIKLETPVKVIGVVELTLGPTRGPLIPVKVLQGPGLEIVPIRQKTFAPASLGQPFDDVLPGSPENEKRWRYFRASFKARGISYCVSARECFPRPEARYLINLVPVKSDSTLVGTAFSRLVRADGLPSDPHDALNLVPVFNMDEQGEIDRENIKDVRFSYDTDALAASPIQASLPGFLFSEDYAFPLQMRTGDGCFWQERFTRPAERPDRPLADESGNLTITYAMSMDKDPLKTPATVKVVMAVVESLIDGSEVKKEDPRKFRPPWASCDEVTE